MLALDDLDNSELRYALKIRDLDYKGRTKILHARLKSWMEESGLDLEDEIFESNLDILRLDFEVMNLSENRRKELTFEKIEKLQRHENAVEALLRREPVEMAKNTTLGQATAAQIGVNEETFEKVVSETEVAAESKEAAIQMPRVFEEEPGVELEVITKPEVTDLEEVAELVEVSEQKAATIVDATLGPVEAIAQTDEVIEVIEEKVESIEAVETQEVVEAVNVLALEHVGRIHGTGRIWLPQKCRCVTPALEYEGPKVVAEYTSPFPSVLDEKCFDPRVGLTGMLFLIVTVSILIGVSVMEDDTGYGRTVRKRRTVQLGLKGIRWDSRPRVKMKTLRVKAITGLFGTNKSRRGAMLHPYKRVG